MGEGTALGRRAQGGRTSTTTEARETCARALAQEAVDWLDATSNASTSAACGIALLAGYAGDPVLRDAAVRALTRARAAKAPHFGLHGGLAEIGWTAAHLARRGAIEIDAKLEAWLRSLDEALVQRATHPDTPSELVAGLAGFGVYALERDGDRTEELLSEVIRAWRRRTTIDEHGCAWLCEPVVDLGPSWVDLGLAHGLPSFVPVLACAVRRGIEVTHARALLDAVVRTVERFGLREGAVAREGVDLADRSAEYGASWDLGWCYGDLGILAALDAAARCLGDSFDHRLSHLDACLRSGTKMSQPHICHGSAGALLMTSRLAHRRAELAVPALERLDAELDACVREQTSVDESSVLLLYGRTGIALTLLRAAGTPWDRKLGLSTVHDET